jgi:hypothetical protein
MDFLVKEFASTLHLKPKTVCKVKHQIIKAYVGMEV